MLHYTQNVPKYHTTLVQKKIGVPMEFYPDHT